jgi:hypothetical protein
MNASNRQIRILRNEISVREAMEQDGANLLSACQMTIRDGFTTGMNVGNTLYNVFRTDVVRKAQLPCRLWHWVPVKGRYYMGVVMVDSPEGPERVEIDLRGSRIGTIEACEGDNRRHLYWFSEPFDFEFAETLELRTAADDRPYVVEGFLFLPEAPQELDVQLAPKPNVLATPPFEPHMLPKQLAVRNPSGCVGVHPVAISLALPGLAAAAVSAKLPDGTPVPCRLTPLTFVENTPLNQQLHLLIPFRGDETETIHLKQEQSQSCCVTRPPKLSIDDGALSIDSVCGHSVKLRPRLISGDGSTSYARTARLEHILNRPFESEAEAVFDLPGLRTTLALRFSHDLQEVAVEHSFTVTGGDPFLEIRELALEILTDADATATPVAATVVRAQDHDQLLIDNVPVAEFACADNGTLGIAPDEFTELHPCEIRTDSTRIIFAPLPAGFAPPADLTEDERDRRYFFVTEAGYKLKRGMMRRQRFLLYPTGQPERGQRFLSPSHIDLPRRYKNGGLWYDTGQQITPELAEFATRSIDAWRLQQTQLNSFGLFNYGDWFGERCCNWGNGEYDTSFGFLQTALLAHNQDCLQIGVAVARHQLEVDTIHDPNDPFHPWQIRHCMGHVGDYFADEHRVGAYGGRGAPNISHNWVEGMLLYYLLTGDRLARDTATTLLDALSEKALHAKYFSNGRDVGWHLLHLTAGAAVFRSPDYLTGAEQLVKLAIERQRADGSWRRVLAADHCTCYPHHTGNTGFMIGVLLESLMKYHQFTQDKTVEATMRRGAEFVRREIHDTESDEFRYTSCPNSRATHHEWLHLGVPLAYIAAFEHDAEKCRYYRERTAAYLQDYYRLMESEREPACQMNAPGKQLSKAMRLLPLTLAKNNCKTSQQKNHRDS